MGSNLNGKEEEKIRCGNGIGLSDGSRKPWFKSYIVPHLKYQTPLPPLLHTLYVKRVLTKRQGAIFFSSPQLTGRHLSLFIIRFNYQILPLEHVRAVFNKSCFLCDLLKWRKIQSHNERPELNAKEMIGISECTADVYRPTSTRLLFTRRWY
jgi:hypothetical protein